MLMNLSEAVYHWGNYYPDSTAVRVGDKHLTYGEIEKQVSHFVSGLYEIIGNKKAVLGICLDSPEQEIICIISSVRMNIEFVVLNKHASKSVNHHIHKETGITHLVVTDRSTNTLNVENVDYNELCHHALINRVFVPTSIYDNIGYFLSSGSTGLPKCYSRNQYSILTETVLWMIELQFVKETALFISKPLSYGGAFTLVYTSLFCGGCLIFPQEFSDNCIFNELTRNYTTGEIDIAFLMPNTIRFFLKQDTSKLAARKVLTMGAPIHSKEKLKFADAFSCAIDEVWGNSEGLGTIARYEMLDTKPESIGRPTFTDKVFIVNEQGEELPPRQIGFIAGFSDNECSNLHNVENQIIVSEDIGYSDIDGDIFFVGRKENTIRFGNNKYITTGQLEFMLQDNLHDIECSVTFSMIDGYHTINAFITNPALVDSVEKVLGDYRENGLDLKIYVLKQIPHTHTGKVDLNQLMLLGNKTAKDDAIETS